MAKSYWFINYPWKDFQKGVVEVLTSNIVPELDFKVWRGLFEGHSLGYIASDVYLKYSVTPFFCVTWLTLFSGISIIWKLKFR